MRYDLDGILPDDLKKQCIQIVRGHDRRVLLYHMRRDDVLHSSQSPELVMHDDGKRFVEVADKNGRIKTADRGLAGALIPRSGRLHDPTLTKAQKLEHIDTLPDTKMMVAVDQAKLLIGLDCDEDIRQKLMEAIWDSCIYGRNFKLEHYDIPVSKATFYRRRTEFLYNIARNMSFL